MPGAAANTSHSCAALERAFRGELVPQDPSDERAELLLARVRAAEPARPRRPLRE